MTKANNVDLGPNPLPSRVNLKPITNNRRAGGGLCAIGYEPNKNSIFNDGLGAFNFNRNRQVGGFKAEPKPVIMKEDIFSKKDIGGGIFGYNNRNDVDRNRNPYSKNDKFSSYERSNPLINQLQKDCLGGIGRRKRNYFSQNNNSPKFNWDL